MSTNKKYVGEEAAEVLAAGIGAASPRTWDLTPDDPESVTEEERDGMAIMQFPTPSKLKESLAEIKAGDRLDVSKVLGASGWEIAVASIVRFDEAGISYCNVVASLNDPDEGVIYNLLINNDDVSIVVMSLGEQKPQKLSASAGGSSWQYGAIPNWGDLGERPSCWSYYGTGFASQPIDFKIGDTFRTPTLVPYGCPPSEASDDPADQAAANYAEGTIVGTGKVQNVPYLVAVGAARFGKKTSATAKDDETITAPGIFYVTRPSTNSWYVKFYPLLNKWKELEKIAGEILVISAGLGIADEKINATRDRLGRHINAVPPRVIVGRLPRIGSKRTHNYYLTPLLLGDGSWIPVSLTTPAFKDWLGDENTTEPFIIKAVGLERVYLSLSVEDPRGWIKPELSPLTITVADDVATIEKKTPGPINTGHYGLFADMSVLSTWPDETRASDRRRIVRYDETRGWIACSVPRHADGFAIDRLAPPTFQEVCQALTASNRWAVGYPIEIQFRSRAIRPKGVTGVEATKKYHFWSHKKKRGSVFRVRRTLGARGHRCEKIDVGNSSKLSYAHRNFKASEWHYYSVKWKTYVGADGKKEYRIMALRRLG